MLNNIVGKIGWISLALGISTADSENLLIPLTLIIIGALMLKIHSKLYI